MKITSSKNNFAFSDSESGFYTLSANQTTGITENDPVKFDTAEVGSNVTFNPATYTWTLKKNRRYKLNASLLALFTADTGRVTIRFYDVTNSAYLGIRSYSTAPNFSTARNSTSSSTNIIITPATDILVQCRIQSVSGLDYFYTGYAYCEIQQLNVVSPVIQDPSISVQAGVVQAYAGATIPAGYLNCDGSAISRTTYSKLFSALSTTWGAGDGSTTFNLPDLRSATLRGVGTPTLYTSNTVITLAQTIDDKGQGHWHTVMRRSQTSTFRSYTAGGGAAGATYAGQNGDTNYDLVGKTMTDDGTNGTPRVGLETTGKARGIYWVIKY